MKSLVTLSELFSDRIFRIPDYQRGYVWQEDQLRDFWEDIVNLPKGHSHYTGMISLKELDNTDINQWDSEDRWIINDQGYRAYHVIDGQQRLTTFIIFLKCIVELTSSIGETRINNEEIELIINKYLYEENKDGMLRAYKFGYEKDNPSFDYLKHHILDEDDTTQLEKTFYTLNLQNAKDYFKKQLEELYKEGFDKIEEIFFKATQKFILTSMKLNRDLMSM